MKAVQQRTTQSRPSGKSQGAMGRRKGNPGKKSTGKPTKSGANGPSAIPNGDPFTRSQLENVEQPLSEDGQQRLAVLKQIQEQIEKKGQESTGSPDEAFQIEQLLHGYVASCHNAAMEFMKTNESRAAGRILRQCEDYCKRSGPPKVTQIVVQKGILHTIYNNLAQHSNMVADMNSSIEYLEKALEAAENPETDQELLPLAETYLNLANGYSFLNKYDSALVYAEKAARFAKHKCNKLREEIQDTRSNNHEDFPNPKIESLDYQLNDFIAIKIMAHLCVGEQHERLGSFNAAIKFFSEGKQYAETNFGTKHPLYTKCINAMGGARLKSKYQTKENYRNVNNSQQSSKPEKMRKIKKGSASKESRSHEQDSSIKSKLMARRLLQGNQDNQGQQRRNIAGAVRKAEVRMSNMMRNHQDNLLLANCDTWTSMHCRHPRPKKRESLLVSIEKQKRRNSSRQRSFSAMSERKQSRSERLTQDFLGSITDNKRAPYKVVCKIGPTCKNHNWNMKSPLKKVCTRGPNCPNHDWDCSRSMNSSRSSFRKSMSMRSTKTQQPVPQPPIQQVQEVVNLPEVVIQQPEQPRAQVVEVPDNNSQGNHSCMLEQTERVHQQQMQHMRSMQEDQFKMLQLVMENSQQKSAMSQQQQQQQAYMYHPQMQNYGAYYQPQFYNQAQYGGWQHPMYHQQQYAQADGGHTEGETDGSVTETDMSDAEQVMSGRKPAQSELSKAEMLEQAYQKQQEEMLNMQRRMSQMQVSYVEQINNLKASQEAFKVQVQSRSARAPSSHSDRKPISQKDYREDTNHESEINERVDEVLYGGSIAEKPMQRDASAQVFDSLKNGGSILKQSTIKSRGVGYHSTVIDNSARSDGRSELGSIHNSPNRNQSFKSRASSFASNKSFRIPQGQYAMSRDDAAKQIQNSYRGYRARQDYKLMKRRRTTKKFLFRATVRSNVSQIITCSVHLTSRGKPDSLSFLLDEARRTRHSQKLDIDLRQFNITEITDFKDKVMRIIRDSLATVEILASIQQAFQTSQAQEIMEAEFFSSDDNQSYDFGQGKGLPHNASTSTLQEISEEQVIQPKPLADQQVGYEPALDSRSQIDAEIERIRKKCDIKYTVDVDQISIRGHKRKFDDYTAEDVIDEEINKHIKCDEDDDSRRIVINEIAVKRNKDGVGMGMDSDSCCDSQHDYEFMIGKGEVQNTTVVRRFSLWQIIKIQSHVRRFLARCQTRNMKQILYNGILRRENRLVRFTLTKNRRHDYTLIAIVTMSRNLRKLKQLIELPFEDDEAKEKFEAALLFTCDGFEISELDLKQIEKEVAPPNPFSEADTHLFITDYNKGSYVQDTKIYSWKLKGEYPCELWCIPQLVKGETVETFKVIVSHQKQRHYLKLHKLAVEVLYMAYYLNEQCNLHFNQENVFSYIYITELPNKRQFLRYMEETEIRFFGGTRKQYKNTNKTIDYSKKTPFEPRKFETLAPKANEFLIERNSVTYIVEVFDERETKGKFCILVKRKDDPTDKDWISVTQMTPFMDELIGYLKENLRVYVKPTGSIDYLALANDYKIFSAQNRRRLRESNSASRVDNSSQRDSSLSAMSQQTNNYSNQQKALPQLGTILNEFTIQRNDMTYKVNVQERLNHPNKPLQITVTSIVDPKDSKYMVYRSGAMRGQQLQAYLCDHLMVYNKLDQTSNSNYIDFVALTSIDDSTSLRRSATVQIGGRHSNPNPITQKSLIKARGRNRLEQDSIQVDSSIDISRQANNTINGNLSPKNNWQQLAKQTFWTDNRQIDAILLSKNQPAPRKTRVPIPRGPDDTDYFKIQLVDNNSQAHINELNLSVQACQILLNLTRKDLLPDVKTASLKEIMQSSANYDATQIELLKTSCAYQRNKNRYTHILMSIIYEQSSNELRFDIDQICASQESDIQSDVHQSQMQSSPSSSMRHKNLPSKIKTVGITSKLSSSNRKAQPMRGRPDLRIMSDQEEGMGVGSGIDSMPADSIPSNKSTVIPVIKYQIVKKSEIKTYHVEPESAASSIQEDQSDFPNESQAGRPNKSSSIVKTNSGQFLNILVNFDGANYQLTVNDRIKRGKPLCENMTLPNAYIDSIEDDGFDRTQAVKKAIERKLKSESEITNQDGSLNANLFN